MLRFLSSFDEKPKPTTSSSQKGKIKQKRVENGRNKFRSAKTILKKHELKIIGTYHNDLNNQCDVTVSLISSSEAKHVDNKAFYLLVEMKNKNLIRIPLLWNMRISKQDSKGKDKVITIMSPNQLYLRKHDPNNKHISLFFDNGAIFELWYNAIIESVIYLLFTYTFRCCERAVIGNAYCIWQVFPVTNKSINDMIQNNPSSNNCDCCRAVSIARLEYSLIHASHLLPASQASIELAEKVLHLKKSMLILLDKLSAAPLDKRLILEAKQLLLQLEEQSLIGILAVDSDSQMLRNYYSYAKTFKSPSKSNATISVLAKSDCKDEASACKENSSFSNCVEIACITSAATGSKCKEIPQVTRVYTNAEKGSPAPLAHCMSIQRQQRSSTKKKKVQLSAVSPVNTNSASFNDLHSVSPTVYSKTSSTDTIKSNINSSKIAKNSTGSRRSNSNHVSYKGIVAVSDQICNPNPIVRSHSFSKTLFDSDIKDSKEKVCLALESTESIAIAAAHSPRTKKLIMKKNGYNYKPIFLSAFSFALLMIISCLLTRNYASFIHNNSIRVNPAYHTAIDQYFIAPADEVWAVVEYGIEEEEEEMPFINLAIFYTMEENANVYTAESSTINEATGPANDFFEIDNGILDTDKCSDYILESSNILCVVDISPIDDVVKRIAIGDSIKAISRCFFSIICLFVMPFEDATAEDIVDMIVE